MSQYFLGVDIGGTKSHALIADGQGCAVGFGEAGAGNHEVVGYEGLAATLKRVVDRALAEAGIGRAQIAGAGFGVAGYDWPSERPPTLEVIGQLGLTAPLEAVNDAVLGLLAGAADGWGVAVVAGTSNNCRGWDRQRREGRVTGNGSWFGEYGGASELVVRAQHAVAAQWTHRGPKTALTEAFIAATGARDIADLLEGLALERYRLSAEAAPLVFRVAGEGDNVARGLIEWSGRELADLAIGVIRQLNFEALAFDVILVGSMYRGGMRLIETMRESIHQVAPGARLLPLDSPPVIGGVLLGMEQAGLETRPVRDMLIRSTERLLQRHNRAARVEDGKDQEPS